MAEKTVAKRVIGVLLISLLLKNVLGVVAKGTVEIHFINYQDTCYEDFTSGYYCDPMFNFCLTRPSAPSNSVGNCYYAISGRSAHYHNTDNIDFTKSIGGIPNPWIVKMQDFKSKSVKLVIKVRDSDLIFDDDIHIWGDTFTAHVYPSKAEAKWASKILYHAGEFEHTMKFHIRMYCDPDYYTSTCEKYCKAQQSTTTGHYTCDKTTGAKICMTGWKGISCSEDVNECALAYCKHGTCENSRGGYKCNCPPHYIGKNCSVMDNPCEETPCQNQGTCFAHLFNFEYFCKCTNRWKGKNCDVMTEDPCENSPCSNGRHCLANPDMVHYMCTCPYAYTGNRCEVFSPTTTTTTASTTTAESTTTRTTDTPTTSITTTTPPAQPLATTPIPTGSEHAAQNGSNRKFSSSTSSPQPRLTSYTTPIQKSSDEDSSTPSITYGARGGPPKQVQPASSRFEMWYIPPIGAILIIVLALLLFVVIRKRRRKKKALYDPSSSTVIFNAGPELTFENDIYTRSNTDNSELERQTRTLPPVPTTPTEDELFHPVKRMYNERDETYQGAVGGEEVNREAMKVHDNAVPSAGYMVTRPVNCERVENPYMDFYSLKRQSHRAKEDNDYDELPTIHSTPERDNVQEDPSTLYSTPNPPPRRQPLAAATAVAAPNSSYDTELPEKDVDAMLPIPPRATQSDESRNQTGNDYDIPRSLLVASREDRTHLDQNDSDTMDDDSSGDENDDQEDIAQLRRSVRDKQRQNLEMVNPEFLQD